MDSKGVPRMSEGFFSGHGDGGIKKNTPAKVLKANLNAETVRNAIILQEILGSPVSRRRRRKNR